MKKILVRFDDICPTMNFRQFERAMEIMDKYGIKPLIGVIPNSKDPDLEIEPSHDEFWTFVKSLEMKGYSIAMHGVDHVFDNHCRGNVVSRFDSEFAGHSLEKQIEKISRGKKILEMHDIHTDVFFAPGHSYDDNTLKSLSSCGFRFMSDGKSRKPYMKYGIKCLPCRSGGIPAMKFGSLHTAVLHAHEWENGGYDDFVKLIETHRNSIVTWDEYSSVSSGNKWLQLMDEKIYVCYQRYVYPVIMKILKTLK